MRRSGTDTLPRLEAGYDGNFDASDLTRDQSSGLSVLVTPTSRIVLQMDFDGWASKAVLEAVAETGGQAP
jgi:hypothetical protein